MPTRTNTPTTPTAIPGLVRTFTNAAERLDASASHLGGLLLALRVQDESGSTRDALTDLVLACERVGREFIDHIGDEAGMVSEAAADLARLEAQA